MIDEVVIYLHGGAYVHEMSSFHWRFVRKLVDVLDCYAYVPKYPLAIKEPYSTTMDFIIALYKQIITQSDPEKVIIMGDSAGGGMVLALAQLIRKRKLT